MATLKQHDTARRLTDTLTLDGAAIDLTGATVSIIFRNRFTGEVSKQTATIVAAVDGTVEYWPTADDVIAPGVFDIEWEIVFADSKQLSCPTTGYDSLTILADLG